MPHFVKVFVHEIKCWYPTGGTFDKQGNMWILEGNEKNEIRAGKPVNLHYGKTLFSPADKKHYT